MKNSLKITGFIVFLFILSCRKPEDNTVYTISGTLIENCGGTPKPNAYMEMFQNWFSGSGSSQRLYTYTDNNGRFKFEYKNETDSHISLWYGTNSNNTTKILMGLPAKQNIELGNVYVENKTYLYVKINCNSPHSISDTLYYAIFGTKTSIGPFQTILYDSVLASKGVFAGENSYNIPNETGNLVWGLGYEDFMRANNSLRPNILDYHIECFTYRGCGYKDTAFINVP